MGKIIISCTKEERLVSIIYNQVIKKLNMTQQVTDEEVYKEIDTQIDKIASECFIRLKTKQNLRIQVFNSLRRLDILQELLDDNSITEIMVNGAKSIFFERKGKLFKWKKNFSSEEKLREIIQKIVGTSNRIVNESNPIVDTRLEDGSRVNIVLPPVTLDGAVITIRKFGKSSMTMKQLIDCDSITKEVSLFLECLVRAKYNIFISGGTGSGKTTFLNALSNYIPSDERIITIEDSAELQIQNIDNLVRLEVRNGNVEGKNKISIRQLIKSALRMRPDRIIVGEVRDEAAIDLLTALNTGHDGSLSTGHANSSIDMLHRLETLVLLGSDIPLMAARRQIISAIDIIVHLGRLRDKSRKVLEVVEVLGIKDNEIQLNPLYCFHENKGDAKMVIGSLRKTDNKLYHTNKLSKAGILNEF